MCIHTPYDADDSRRHRLPMESPRLLGPSVIRPPDLHQLEPEGFELVEYAVERCLVGELSPQKSVPAHQTRGEGREGLKNRRPDRATDTDLVAPWPFGARVCHIHTLAPLWMSAHHMGWMILAPSLTPDAMCDSRFRTVSFGRAPVTCRR